MWFMSSLKHHLARGLCFCHTHALTSLRLVPIAKLTHMPHSFGPCALHLLDQTAASVVHSSLFLHVPVWGCVCVYIWGFGCAVNRQIWWPRWQSWPREDICSSFTCRWLQWMGPTKQWLLWAHMLHQVYLFRSWMIWWLARWPAFHLCSIFVHVFVYVCVFSFGCLCCLVILFYPLRDMLTLHLCSLNIFD